MERNLFEIFCSFCKKKVNGIVIGEDSFVQLKCPHCKNELMIKSKRNRIKVKHKITLGYEDQEANVNVELSA